MRALRLLAVAFMVAACGSGPIFANPPAERGAPIPTPSPIAVIADPQPVVLPRDDGPHRRLTEWWYYTGHLVTDAGRRFGFEFVIFRAERGSFPVTWASHLALTDEQGRRFLYDQRTAIGPVVDGSPRASDGTPTGFALAVAGGTTALDPTSSGAPSGAASASSAAPWTMAGASGSDTIVAAGASADGSPFGLDLRLHTDLPAVLHDTIGYIGFGEAGGSYYYSRPRMQATGSITLGGQTMAVTGEAWFDHQWGDFISVGGGGWDWFAVNLADGTALTLSLVRDASGATPLVYGTLVQPDGTYEHLGREAFSVDVTGTWTSPKTAAVYPSGWRIRVPVAALDISLQPTIVDQELDTRSTTGVVYWEGSQVVTATTAGAPIGGEAYVELTGYGPGSVKP